MQFFTSCDNSENMEVTEGVPSACFPFESMKFKGGFTSSGKRRL